LDVAREFLRKIHLKFQIHLRDNVAEAYSDRLIRAFFTSVSEI